jgi:hypothetical protein
MHEFEEYLRPLFGQEDFLFEERQQEKETASARKRVSGTYFPFNSFFIKEIQLIFFDHPFNDTKRISHQTILSHEIGNSLRIFNPIYILVDPCIGVMKREVLGTTVIAKKAGGTAELNNQ